MNIAIVTINQENAAIASWLAAQDFSGCTLAHWQIEPQPVVAEQVLDALVEQWQRTPADVVLFPPGTFGDELSTRLAWRLHGASICQVTSLEIPTVSVRKSHWGNALTATLQTEKRPLCLSLARQAGADKNATLPSGMQQLNRCWMRWWNSGSERLRTLFSFRRERLAMNCRPGWPGVYMVQASAR